MKINLLYYERQGTLPHILSQTRHSYTCQPVSLEIQEIMMKQFASESSPLLRGVWGRLKGPQNQNNFRYSVMFFKPLLDPKCDIHIGVGHCFVKGGTSSQVYIYIYISRLWHCHRGGGCKSVNLFTATTIGVTTPCLHKYASAPPKFRAGGMHN